VAEQYIERTVDYEAYRRVNPTAGSTTMIEAQFTPRGRQSWRRWYNCRICGLTFPEDEVRIVNGAPYCIKFKHYLEAIHHDAKDLS
jgi:hypothetical protein